MTIGLGERVWPVTNSLCVSAKFWPLFCNVLKGLYPIATYGHISWSLVKQQSLTNFKKIERKKLQSLSGMLKSVYLRAQGSLGSVNILLLLLSMFCYNKDLDPQDYRENHSCHPCGTMKRLIQTPNKCSFNPMKQPLPLERLQTLEIVIWGYLEE